MNYSHEVKKTLIISGFQLVMVTSGVFLARNNKIEHPYLYPAVNVVWWTSLGLMLKSLLYN